MTRFVRVHGVGSREHPRLVTAPHGDRGSRAALGGLPAGWRVWQSDLEALRSAMAARENVSRFAASRGYVVTVSQQGDDFTLLLKKQ